MMSVWEDRLLSAAVGAFVGMIGFVFFVAIGLPLDLLPHVKWMLLTLISFGGVGAICGLARSLLDEIRLRAVWSKQP